MYTVHTARCVGRGGGVDVHNKSVVEPYHPEGWSDHCCSSQTLLVECPVDRKTCHGNGNTDMAL